MAVGKQAETLIVHWHPGDPTGTDGLGVPGAALPVDAITTASGSYAFLDARIDTEQTARAAVNTRVSSLGTRLVASGVLPTSV